jgi:death-on-curing family protein
VDGNKRTGVTMGSYLLSTFGYEVEATQQELEDFGVEVARGALDLEEIARWFEDHAEPA